MNDPKLICLTFQAPGAEPVLRLPTVAALSGRLEQLVADPTGHPEGKAGCVESASASRNTPIILSAHG